MSPTPKKEEVDSFQDFVCFGRTSVGRRAPSYLSTMFPAMMYICYYHSEYHDDTTTTVWYYFWVFVGFPVFHSPNQDDHFGFFVAFLLQPLALPTLRWYFISMMNHNIYMMMMVLSRASLFFLIKHKNNGEKVGLIVTDSLAFLSLPLKSRSCLCLNG